MIRDMGRKTANYVKRNLGYILAVVSIITCFSLAGMFAYECKTIKAAKVKRYGFLTEAERDEARAMHRYHGIIVSYVDEWGREWFIREGQKCWINRKGNVNQKPETISTEDN